MHTWTCSLSSLQSNLFSFPSCLLLNKENFPSFSKSFFQILRNPTCPHLLHIKVRLSVTFLGYLRCCLHQVVLPCFYMSYHVFIITLIFVFQWSFVVFPSNLETFSLVSRCEIFKSQLKCLGDFKKLPSFLFIWSSGCQLKFNPCHVFAELAFH